MKSIIFNSIPILPNSCLQVKTLSFLLVISSLFSTTVVTKRASVTFIAKVQGVVLKDFLGALPQHTLSSSPVYLQLRVSVNFYNSTQFYPPLMLQMY